MDEQSNQIHNLLLNSLSPAQEVRKDAESKLQEYAAREGFLSVLLDLINNPNVNPTAKQAALSTSTSHQEQQNAKDGGLKLSSMELQYIRANIIRAYISCSINHRKLIYPSISKLIQENYRDEWPDLLPSLFHMLQSSSDMQLLVGVIDILRIAVDVDNTSTKNQNHAIYTTGFPLLLNIASKTISTSTISDGSCLLLKAVLKTFFTAVQFVLPKDLQPEAIIDPWMGLCIHILSMPLSDAITPYDAETDEQTPFFKMKKWALHIAIRICSRYGLDEETKFRPGNYSQFSKLYMSKYAAPTLDVILSLIENICSRPTQKILPSRLITLICDYLDAVILSNKLWKRIKLNIEPIIKLFIFPYLCFTEDDERTWAENPYEYVHKRLDPFEDLESLSWAASHLLGHLVKKRKKSVFLILLNFINEIFHGFQNPSSPYYNNVRAKEGALMVVGTISSTILEAPELKGQTESLIISAVLPDMSSESPFLRARACWVIQNYGDLRYSTVDNVLAVFQGILRCLGDISPGNLPIRIQAALALGVFLQFEEVTPLITANLAPIIQSLLDLTNQSDMDSLSYVLEKLVSLYSVELTPFALQLTQQLCATLVRLISHPKVIQSLSPASISEEENEESSDFDLVTDKMMTAMGLLRTLTTLVASVKSNSELTERMEALFHEPISLVLQYNISDLFEDILELIDSITFVRKTISPQMWNVFPILCEYYLNGNMSEYINELLPSFDNFISYGKDLVSSNAQIQAMFVAIIEKAMKSDGYGDEDRVSGCQLMASMLLCCRGSIDNLVPHFLGLTLGRFRNYSSKSSIVHHMEVVLNCVIYDAMLTLKVFTSMSNLPSFKDVLGYIAISKSAFSRVHDKRLVVIAMSQLLRCPGIDTSLCCPLFTLLREAFETLPKSIDHRKMLEEQAEDEREEESTGYYSSDISEEDEDDLKDAQGNTSSFTSEVESTTASEESEDDDISEWEESELEEELYHETPLDGINLYDMAMSAVSELSTNNPNVFTYLNTQVSEKEALMTAFNTFQTYATIAAATAAQKSAA